MPPKTSSRASGKSGGSSARSSGAKSRLSAKDSSAKTTGAKGSGRPPGKGGKGRKVNPVKPGLPWGMIALGAAVGLAALAIIGYPAYQAWDANQPFGDRRAQKIDGVKNFRDDYKKKATHKPGNLSYKQSPPVAGDHNEVWENCEGDVYSKPIPKEHAVHSMEHGAVWVTYRPDLPKSDVKKLEKQVKGVNFTLMSPYPGLDKPVSVQAWGFQLKLDNASDERVGEFIKGFRELATVEPGAACAQGTKITGDKPEDRSQTPGLPGQAPGAPVPGQPG
jgi:hypothetical protein